MTNNAQKDNSAEINIWPNRFCVGAMVDLFCHENYMYKDVLLELYQVNMPKEESQCIVTSLGYAYDINDENVLGLISQAEDSFSESQAQQLIDYIKTFKGTKVLRVQAIRPTIGYKGYHSYAPAPSIGIYDFTDLPDYPLDFATAALYIVCPENCLGLHPEEERRLNLRSRIENDLRQQNSIEKLEELSDFNESAIRFRC